MSVPVALAAHRLSLAPAATREERLRRCREMLAHALNQETTVAVVGSGCSVPLGYPSWRGFAGELIEEALKASGCADDVRKRLLRFKDRLDSGESTDSQGLMFHIGICKRILGGHSAENSPYHGYLGARFRPREEAVQLDGNPHRTLWRMPIHRVVTTNYDWESERALAAERDVPWEDLGLGSAWARESPRLSFTQRPENCGQLALFALARVGMAKNMVFHCHGRCDDPSSVVATELDYQRWYFAREEEAVPPFLQMFDLLFNSNPILFVGFGLGDEDLLRPLRRIGATSPERREFRPLFALLPEAVDGDDWDRHELLFERYGLNVIPFVAPTASTPSAWGRRLCAELERLDEERLEWRDRWLEKPVLRKVKVRARPRAPYRHYGVDPGSQATIGSERVAAELDRLKRDVIGGARLIGLVGPGGSGKSWHAMWFLEAMRREANDFDGFFFWSSYYADDAVTGIDRLLEYIDPDGNRSVSRFIRLKQRLQESRYLIVLDGFERLLHPTDDPEIGKSNDAIIRGLLHILADPDSHCTVILTSRLWPFDVDASAAGIEKHVLERMRTTDLLNVEPFSWFTPDEASLLCSLLDGHTYALSLAARFIQRGGRAAAAELLLTLRRSLAGTHPERRLAAMIRLTTEALNRETQQLAQALLERLAVFMSPVTQETVELCFALAAEERRSKGPICTPPVSLREVVDKLLASGLLFEVTAGPEESEPTAFTVHPTVRSYIFQQGLQIERDVLPNFTLAGFTSGRAAVHPGDRRTADIVRQLFDRLFQQAEQELQADRGEVARKLCRSLFGVMRSRMEANTVPRWTTYPEYLPFGLRVADLAKKVSPRLWSFREPHELATIEEEGAPLYADELAFVYNDVGLCLCAEGYMQDTLDVWEQGYEINRIIEGTAIVPLYSLQSQLHLGHTFLELGNLPIAAQYLEETLRTNHEVNDQDYHGRILGYKALISHYRGHLEEAEALYDDSFRKLEEGGGNRRAKSFFLTHRAKLKMVRKLYGQAEELLQSSRALAASERADDLLAYARTATGRLEWHLEADFAKANAEFHAALIEARRLGIRRLEAEVLTGLARLSLRLGDAALARTRAMAALAIANELGLGLRQTSSLLVLGQAMISAGQPGLGVAYLSLAKQLGEGQEYWLRSREAEESLQKLGDPPSNRHAASEKNQV